MRSVVDSALRPRRHCAATPQSRGSRSRCEANRAARTSSALGSSHTVTRASSPARLCTKHARVGSSATPDGSHVRSHARVQSACHVSTAAMTCSALSVAPGTPLRTKPSGDVVPGAARSTRPRPTSAGRGNRARRRRPGQQPRPPPPPPPRRRASNAGRDAPGRARSRGAGLPCSGGAPRCWCSTPARRPPAAKPAARRRCPGRVHSGPALSRAPRWPAARPGSRRRREPRRRARRTGPRSKRTGRSARRRVCRRSTPERDTRACRRSPPVRVTTVAPGSGSANPASTAGKAPARPKSTTRALPFASIKTFVGLEVAVDHVGRVRGSQAPAGVEEDPRDRATGPSFRREPAPQRHAVDALHREVELALVLPDVVKRHDGGVLQPRQGSSFAGEPVPPLGRPAPAGGSEHLQRELAVEAWVVGGQHGARGTATQCLQDEVAADLLWGLQRHRVESERRRGLRVGAVAVGAIRVARFVAAPWGRPLEAVLASLSVAFG